MPSIKAINRRYQNKVACTEPTVPEWLTNDVCPDVDGGSVDQPLLHILQNQIRITIVHVIESGITNNIHKPCLCSIGILTIAPLQFVNVFTQYRYR